MKHFKRIPQVVWPVLLVVLGVSTFLAGLYMLAGVAVTLLAGGVIAAVAGLLVDI